MYLFIQNGFSALTIRKSEYWSPLKNTEYVLLYLSHVQPRCTSLCKINNSIHLIKIQKTIFIEFIEYTIEYNYSIYCQYMFHLTLSILYINILEVVKIFLGTRVQE